MAKLGDGEKWEAMQADWHALNTEARLARFRVMQAFQKSAAGDGAGPTTGQLELAEKLEEAADRKQQEIDAFLQKYFS